MPPALVDPSLLPLVNRKTCVLASRIPNLQLGKEHAMPELDELQLKLVRQPFAGEAAPYSDWATTMVLLRGSEGLPLQATLDLARAPSLLALPVMQKRGWDIPFEVRMSWRAALPLRLVAAVAPFALDDKMLASPEQWLPPAGAPPASLSLIGSEWQEKEVQLTPSMEEAGVYTCSATFIFPKLAFGAPSQMRPRWLGFVGRLGTPDSFLLTVLKVPTVVMSRSADQLPKAQALLWGSAPPVSYAELDYQPFAHAVQEKLHHLGIWRPLSEGCLLFLASKAGFVIVDGAVRRKPSSAEYAVFQKWLEGHLQTIHYCQPEYLADNPQIIAGFDCTRDKAYLAVKDQPLGTFVLRFGSKAGQLVMTVRNSQGRVDHVLLSQTRLHSEGLQNAVLAYPEARTLLDMKHQTTHPVQSALQWHYIIQDDCACARKRSRDEDYSTGESGALPTTGVDEETAARGSGGNVPSVGLPSGHETVNLTARPSSGSDTAGMSPPPGIPAAGIKMLPALGAPSATAAGVAQALQGMPPLGMPTPGLLPEAPPPPASTSPGAHSQAPAHGYGMAGGMTGPPGVAGSPGLPFASGLHPLLQDAALLGWPPPPLGVLTLMDLEDNKGLSPPPSWE